MGIDRHSFSSKQTGSKKNGSKRGELRRGELVQPAIRSRDVLPPGLITNKAKKESADCSLLTTRIVGSISLVMGLLLLAIGTIIFAQPCCGDHFSYNEERWNKECRIDEGETDDLYTSETSTGSCYHRNIGVGICYLISILGFGIGLTVILIGECMFSINYEKEEQNLEEYIRYMRQREIEMVEEEKYRRQETRTEISELERTERLDIGRRYSIGNPNTPSDRQLNALYTPERTRQQPQVVASHPYVYGQSRPYAVV